MPLQLEAKIPLGDVKGRIDHMAVDLDRRRLFVAELGNDSVGIVDLSASKVSGRLRGLKEPQGVGYVPSTDTLYVTNAGDGSVRLFQGQDLKETGRIELGDDADNVRVDSPGNRVIIGYGAGALAIIDAKDNRKIAEFGLDGHPESFRLESNGSRIFVNVPEAHAIEVADRQSGRVTAKWPAGHSGANFPMALDEASQQVLVVFRSPPTLTAFSMQDGVPVATAGTCGDSDDVFVDAKRRRDRLSVVAAGGHRSGAATNTQGTVGDQDPVGANNACAAAPSGVSLRDRTRDAADESRRDRTSLESCCLWLIMPPHDQAHV
jgi:DNA-binding beta-propeller fold protein YncE